jgi:hypothetical protein
MPVFSSTSKPSSNASERWTFTDKNGVPWLVSWEPDTESAVDRALPYPGQSGQWSAALARDAYGWKAGTSLVYAFGDVENASSRARSLMDGIAQFVVDAEAAQLEKGRQDLARNTSGSGAGLLLLVVALLVLGEGRR